MDLDFLQLAVINLKYKNVVYGSQQIFLKGAMVFKSTHGYIRVETGCLFFLFIIPRMFRSPYCYCTKHAKRLERKRFGTTKFIARQRFIQIDRSLEIFTWQSLIASYEMHIHRTNE